MNKKLNIIIAIGVVVIAIASLFSLFRVSDAPIINLPNQNLGGGTAQYLEYASSASATTSPTYFGVGGTLTATTTLLTVSNIEDAKIIALNIQANASTTGSIIYIRPEVSNNNVDWFGVSNALYEPIANAGVDLGEVTYNTASGTIFAWQPNGLGVQGQQFLIKNIVGKYLRFRVSAATASSSVWMQVTKVVETK